MQPIQHPYLCPNAWQGKGTFYNADGHFVDMIEARTITAIDDGALLIDQLRVLRHPRGDVQKEVRTLLTPIAQPGDDAFDFCLKHPEHGALHGVVQCKDDALQLRYTSPDGRFSGMEMLYRVNDYTYDVSAVLFVDGKRLCAWECVLRDVNAPKKEEAPPDPSTVVYDEPDVPRKGLFGRARKTKD